MRNLTLLTDLYQLTMMNGYYKNDKANEIAVFDLFFRQNDTISYSISAGLEQAIDYVLNLHFDDEDISYLKGLNLFEEDFLNYLKDFKFTGDIYAVEEGTPIFPNEPILIVKAPLIQAQFIETALLNIINHQTLIATKASKICSVTKGEVMEFGLRRAQAPDAGIYGARAAVIGGCSGTSNVIAGKMFDLKVKGTHSHSWVMSFPTELEAFEKYAELYPDACLLLVDTYDTLKSGIPNAIKVFKELIAKGHKPLGVRLDSGDLAYLSKMARKMFDDEGLFDVKICASNDLDEYLIQSLTQQGAKIDTWGVGTRLITSENMPSLGGVYKLSALIKDGVEYPKIKLSNNTIKITNPCFKNLYRLYDKDTKMAIADLITLKDEVIDEGKPITLYHPIDNWKKTEVSNYYIEPLLKEIILNGKLVYKMPKVDEIVKRKKEKLSHFWDEYKRIERPHIYKVDLSNKLYEIKKEMMDSVIG